MIVNNTVEINFDTGITDAAATSPAVAAVAPDGTPVAGLSVPLIEGDHTDGTQEIAAYLTPSQAGLYRLTWGYSVGAQALTEGQNRYATWTDVIGFIRGRLNRDETILTDEVIEAEFARVVRLALPRFPCIGSYGALTGDDRENFDEAAAMMVAVRLWAPADSPASTINDFKVGSFTIKYAKDAQDDRSTWTEESAAAFGRIVCVITALKTRVAGFNMFQVAGPSRTAAAHNYPQRVLDRVIDMYNDPLWITEVGRPIL